MSTAPAVHFGGPGTPDRALRDLLAARVAAVPAGGELVWATYYFRDLALADALIAASDRGVRVTLHVEGSPRLADANAAVLTRLGAHGLRGGLNVHRAPAWLPTALHGHLHTKLYGFSHPAPVMLAGSFNPSGNAPEDAAVVAAIGDQDRGHNVLVELTEPALVNALAGVVHTLGRPLARFAPARNRPLVGRQASAWCWPRVVGSPLEPALAGAGAGDRIRGAISHLKRGPLVTALTLAARRGADVAVLVHDTERRVPTGTLAALTAAGVRARRYRHPHGYPLHAKLLLVERASIATAWFGSFNSNRRSRWLNDELLLASTDPAVVAPIAGRLADIFAEAAAG